MTEPLSNDLIVGRMRDNALQVQVSVRGDNIILTYSRLGKGVEVAFSPKAAQQFVEIVQEAIKLAPGPRMYS